MDDRSAGDQPMPRWVDRTMIVGEQGIYIAIAIMLLACAIATLAAVTHGLFQRPEDGMLKVVAGALDGLLLVFILIELYAAVRATMTERHLVAEPFLVVGIIASIKEIVVAALALAGASESKFDDGILKIGVLGGVVLLLALSSFLVRRKEREPAEGDS